MSDHFSFLDHHTYMNLTTFRNSGDKVTTPVWFALDDNRLVIMTDENAGKVKRIRRNPLVEIAPSDSRGKFLGDAVAAQARVLPGDQAAVAEKLLRQKYGAQFTQFETELQKRAQVYLEITPL